MTILVIGYGNPLREDDGVGWYVVDRLAERWGDAIRVIHTHQLTPELSVDLAEASTAFFVDARAVHPERGVEVGTVAPSVGSTHSHSCSPEHLLSLAQALFEAYPQAYLVSIPSYSFDHKDVLTPKARAGADGAVALISQIIARLLASQQPELDQ